MGKVPVQFDLQAKYAVELLDERDRQSGETGRRKAGQLREGWDVKRTETTTKTGRKISVLKNANKAEVKESCTRPKSQADLIVVFVRLTVTFVCSRLTCPRPSPLQSPSEQFPRVHPRLLRFNVPALELAPSLLLYFGRFLARRPI